MILHLTYPSGQPSDPADPSGDTGWPWPNLPPHPSLCSHPTPTGDDMPVPDTGGSPKALAHWACHRCGDRFIHGRLLVAHLIEIHNEGPARRIAMRIGRPPRLPLRERAARILNQSGRYFVAYGLVGWACYWLADIYFAVAGFAIAAMVANPWRPKTRRPRVPAAVRAPLLRGTAGETRSEGPAANLPRKRLRGTRHRSPAWHRPAGAG